MADENIDIKSTVDELLGQLQQPPVVPKPQPNEINLEGENLEKFLLQHSGRLVKGSVEFVEDLQNYIAGAPEAADVEALSKLVASSAAAIESLNKILINNKMTASKILLKNMDIESKKKLQEIDLQGKLLMNREELLKKLIDDAKIVDVAVTELS